MSDKVERSLMAHLVKGLDKDNTEILNLIPVRGIKLTQELL